MKRFLLLLIPLTAWAQCPSNPPLGDPSASPAWNGWGADASNSRFQPEESAQLSAAQVPQLKLKWAFGFAGVKSVLGQPSVVGGRVYIGVDTGAVYSLDANSGCIQWFYKADAGVRTAITVAQVTNQRWGAFFGDLKANVYEVDAITGELIWKVHVDDHASA